MRRRLYPELRLRLARGYSYSTPSASSATPHSTDISSMTGRRHSIVHKICENPNKSIDKS
ncbi:MAG: hypothetical protein LBG28_05740 [Tannerella sp.]|nr:hypothetical protein [Tannerella sp.]